MRLGASSGAALGKVIVSTPFSMAALISSSLEFIVSALVISQR